MAIELEFSGRGHWVDMGDALARIAAILPDDRMRIVFRLRMGGERSTTVFAGALDLEGTPIARQRAEVKREKDRLDRFLRRSAHVRGILAPFGAEHRGGTR